LKTDETSISHRRDARAAANGGAESRCARPRVFRQRWEGRPTSPNRPILAGEELRGCLSVLDAKIDDFDK
jgi:hypothetical protein